jgi:NDP-sugar pyrophosphorylase family protein
VSLRAGVIAAGRGDRLRGAAQTLKPLVRIGGRTLVERVLTSIGEAGPSEVVLIINEASTEVRDHVSSRGWPFELRWIVETTPSSMHSFLRVVETLAHTGDPGPFLISTVDTVAPAGAYARFINEARRHDAAVTLALTAPASDEKPLSVRLDRLDGRTVTAIGDAAAPSEYATAGYYAVRPSILQEADEARRDGLGALRVFLARLLARGYRLDGIPSPDSIDVDRPPDVEAAEAFLRRASL